MERLQHISRQARCRQLKVIDNLVETGCEDMYRDAVRRRILLVIRDNDGVIEIYILLMRSEADDKLIVTEIITTLAESSLAQREQSLRSRESHEVDIGMRNSNLLCPRSVELRIIVNLCQISTEELSTADTDIRNGVVCSCLQRA